MGSNWGKRTVSLCCDLWAIHEAFLARSGASMGSSKTIMCIDICTFQYALMIQKASWEVVGGGRKSVCGLPGLLGYLVPFHSPGKRLVWGSSCELTFCCLKYASEGVEGHPGNTFSSFSSMWQHPLRNMGQKVASNAVTLALLIYRCSQFALASTCLTLTNCRKKLSPMEVVSAILSSNKQRRALWHLTLPSYYSFRLLWFKIILQ